MSLRAYRRALVVLLAVLPACEQADDGTGSAAGRGGAAAGAPGGKSGAGGFGGLGGGLGGAAAGSSVGGTGASGRAGQAAGGASGASNAGRAGDGATSGVGGTAGRASAGGSAGSAGSAVLGGRGGGGGRSGAASAGDSAFAGAGGEPDDPGACPNPFDTLDLADLDASETFEPYVVTGDTANQIRQSINQNRDSDYDAYTSWYVSWQFGDCSGNGLVVTADIGYRFPEWEEPSGASPDLVASWETYLDALFCHEYGHAEHGYDCANEVYDALAAIDAGGDCDEQQSEAQAAFDVILPECQARDVQYDADTNHGATMGAVFPP